MKKLIAIVILAALAWSGYWLFMANMRKGALEGWLAERRADGWVAEADGLKVSGFPNRIDTFVTGLSLADPEEGWLWDAEAFQILSLSWKPHHLIAAWPGEQVIGTPYDTMRIAGEGLRGSVIFRPTPALELDHMTIELKDVDFHGDLGWDARIGSAILATRRPPDAAPDAHEVSFKAEGLVPPNAWTDEIPVSGALPRQMDALDLDAIVTFDRPWDRHAVETENPAIVAIELKDATAIWGELDLRAKGELRPDEDGLAEGEMTLRARNWRQMLDIAEQSQAITPQLAGALRGGLDLLARFSGDGESLTVPLNFENGRARIGPIPVGSAPRLSRR
jgi:hypothetical protein